MVVGIPLQTRQPITLVGEGQRLHSLISIGDVAAFTVQTVGQPCSNQPAIGPVADQNLFPGVESWILLDKVLGQELPVQFVSPGEAIPGLPDIVPPVLAGMETYDSPIPMEATARTFGVELTTLNHFCPPHARYPWSVERGLIIMVDKNDADQPSQSSQLFMLRMWLEDLGSGQTDWRGKVQHVNSGEVRYFRDWQTLETFMEGLLRTTDPEGKLSDG